MNRCCLMLLAALLLCLGAQCAPTQPEENLLAPRQWTQLQSDEQGTGFNGVHTARAVLPLRKWTAGVGDVAFSSPVVDLQGRIWVGNTAGELVGIAPNGTLFARTYVGGTIVSSPAVDEDGRVFVLAQYPNGDSFRTILHEYDPAAGFAPLINPPQYKSTASPKIWGNYVFVPSDRTLRVFDRWTLQLVDEHVGCPTVVCGSFEPPLWVEAIGHVTLCLGTVFLSDLFGLVDCTGFSINALDSLAIEPSVAIVDNPTIVEDTNRPIVLMATPQCLTAFNFDPVGSPKLQIRWQQELVTIDCDFEFLRVTTPAVLDGEQVVVGTDYGQVRSFSIHDGTNLWNYGISEAVECPPVASLREIYVVTTHYFVILDSNGREMSKTLLNGTGGGLSLSLDYAYVMTSEGIHSFSIDDPFNPTSSFDDSVLDGTHVGKTVPAIDRDGNVYLSTPNGVLVAYGRGPSSIPFLVPQVAWISPSEGQSIPYAAGQPLRVSLAGGAAGFTGQVAISSDIDGVLCQFSASDVNEGSCVTAAPLTLGGHVLTVFATDESGGQRTAQISVDAVNSAPTVAVTSPANNATLFSTISVSLIAQVGDAEEDTIASERILWRSDIAGDLGTGASLEVMLGNGLHMLSCIATDEKGATTTASVAVTVTAPIF